MKTVIFGFVGLMVSGKGTAAAYLSQKHHAEVFKFSRILRDMVDRLYVPQTRDTLIRMSEAVRAVFGEDILAKVIAGDAAHAEGPIVVIDGVRRMADIAHLRALPHFVLVEVRADAPLRYARLKERGENADDRTKTYEEFLEDHERSTEKTIEEVIQHAVEHIDNNGNLSSFHAQLDALVQKYGNQDSAT